MPVSPEDTASELIATIPLLMQAMRKEMRSHRALDLSVPQFRSLGFVHRNPETSLSDVAEHIGLTLPSMSKLIDGLVARKLLIRREHQGDRRRMTLVLTPSGRALWNTARKATHTALAKHLSKLGSDECTSIMQAMKILHTLFS